MTRWASPLPMAIVPDPDPEGFRRHPHGTTGLPVGEAHPGAFGFVRANHVHEGVDLYCPEGTPVHAVEDGVVVAVIEFTGKRAEPPSPWWHDTQAVLVEGESGVVVYGEVGVGTGIREGVRVQAGEPVGHVRQVLVKPKTPPRPMSMLHLELHRAGTRDAYEWTEDGGRPPSLLDPTDLLLSAIDEGDRLHLSIDSDGQGRFHRLDLTTRGETRRIGSIRQMGGGDWSWTVALREDGRPGLVDDGIASTADIARSRLYASLEEHDPKRFGCTPGAVAALRTTLADMALTAIAAGRGGLEIEPILDRGVCDAASRATILDQIHVAMPERATVAGFLECHGAIGLGELAASAEARLDRLYGNDGSRVGP